MKKTIRKILKSILFILIFLIIIIVFLLIFRNPILTYTIEKSGSALWGAKIDVIGLNIKLFSTDLHWDNMEVTDRNKTMFNLFETGSCDFSVAFKPLLDRKIIINKFSVDDIKFNTERQVDGKILNNKKGENYLYPILEKLQENLDKEKENIPLLNTDLWKTKLDIDSIIDALDFHTPSKADSVKALVQQRYEYWVTKIKNNDFEKKIKNIENEIKSINIKDMDNIVEIEYNLTKLRNIYDSSLQIQNDFKIIKSDYEQDLEIFSDLKTKVPDWINADINRAVSFAHLSDINIQKIGKMLFGEKVTIELSKLINYINQSRNLSQKNTVPRKESMPELPSFWIKEMSLKITLNNGMVLSGNIFDLSSDHKKTRKPMIIVLNGKDVTRGRISINGNFDYRFNHDETINLLISDIPVRKIDFPNFKLLPSGLKSGNASLTSNINLQKEMFFANIGFELTNLEFDLGTMPELTGNLKSIAIDLINSINEIDFNSEISQKPDFFSFKLNSNLDNILADQIKKSIANEITKARSELEVKVREEIDQYKTIVEDFINENLVNMQNELDLTGNLIDDQEKLIENYTKELDEKIKSEQDKLKQQATDELLKETEKLLDKFKF